MPMDWEEWQKSRQKKGSNGGGAGDGFQKMGDLFSKIQIPRGGGRRLLLLLPALVVVWAALGLFTVESYEVGLVKRFGEYKRSVEPGLNYHLPYPIEDVVKVNITQTRREELGGKTGVSEETMMLTKDENIVDIKFVVQYKVYGAQRWAFQVYDPTKAIRDAATSAMREVIGRNTIDDALTDKRQAIQEDTKATLQTMLDKYEIGVEVQNIELQDVHVPPEVSQAFREVTSAKEDSVRSVNEATGYANEILPQAEGQAFAVVADARAYQAQRVNLALGEAARFNALLTEYKKAPEITRQRLLLETMDRIMPGAEKFLISGEAGRSILPHMGLRPQLPAEPEPARPPASASGAGSSGGDL